MSGNFKKGDLRIQKTYAALIGALIALLNRRNFNDITVNDLCEEALISRATFYVHFNDKYDLFKYWLGTVRKEIIKDVYKYEELEMTVNQFVSKNRKVITNVLKNANNEIINIIQDFMYDILELAIRREISNETSPNHITLCNFCVGGLVHHLLWQVKNNFPAEPNMLNDYLYKMMECIMEWDEKQEQ